MPTNAHTLEEARAAKKRAARVFKPFAAVAGIGLTRVDRGYGLKVNLHESPKSAADLPLEIDGVPVKVEVVGRIRKQLPAKVRTRVSRSS